MSGYKHGVHITFQSLIGNVKRVIYGRPGEKPFQFQSLIGNVKSEDYQEADENLLGFNPS